jgi:phage recombination protein Bet
MNDTATTDKPQAMTPVKRVSLLERIANKYQVDPGKMLTTLKSTAFRQRDNSAITDEQMMALLIVADQYSLNPFTKEIYAYPDKDKGIVPVVSIDGWARIMNSHPDMDGIEFVYSPERVDHKGHSCHEWIDCTIHIKNRKIPVTIREFFGEVVRKPNFATPWDSHPSRMHRHKALIQCARVAFGFAGIYDDDEAQRIMEVNMGAVDVVARSPISDVIRGNAPAPEPEQAGSVIDGATGSVVEAEAATKPPESAQDATTTPAPQTAAIDKAYCLQLIADATTPEEIDYISSLAKEHLKGKDLTEVAKAISEVALPAAE